MTLRTLGFASAMLWAAAATADGGSAGRVDGATVYADHCNRCHEYRSPTEFTGPQWSIVTIHMRVMAGLPGEEARAVFEYLKSQHHPPYRAVEPDRGIAAGDAVARGEALLRERGCLGCHVVAGRGGTMGPSLDGVTTRRSRAFIFQQLRDPRRNNPNSLMPALGLPEDEVQAIWSYLQGRDAGGPP